MGTQSQHMYFWKIENRRWSGLFNSQKRKREKGFETKYQPFKYILLSQNIMIHKHYNNLRFHLYLLSSKTSFFDQTFFLKGKLQVNRTGRILTLWLIRLRGTAHPRNKFRGIHDSNACAKDMLLSSIIISLLILC